MIIDATKHFHPDHRPYTNAAAIAYALSTIKVGDAIDVAGFINLKGQNLSMLRLHVAVSNCGVDGTYQTRKAPAPLMATIRRIA